MDDVHWVKASAGGWHMVHLIHLPPSGDMDKTSLTGLVLGSEVTLHHAVWPAKLPPIPIQYFSVGARVPTRMRSSHRGSQ